MLILGNRRGSTRKPTFSSQPTGRFFFPPPCLPRFRPPEGSSALQLDVFRPPTDAEVEEIRAAARKHGYEEKDVLIGTTTALTPGKMRAMILGIEQEAREGKCELFYTHYKRGYALSAAVVLADLGLSGKERELLNEAMTYKTPEERRAWQGMGAWKDGFVLTVGMERSADIAAQLEGISLRLINLARCAFGFGEKRGVPISESAGDMFANAGLHFHVVATSLAPRR